MNTKRRYEISVWDVVHGDIVKKLWEATEEEYDEVLKQYEDEFGIDVVVDNEWEVEPDEDDDWVDDEVP